MREQILARVAALLLAANTGAGSRVYRARETSITRDMTPSIAVLHAGGTVRRFGQDTDEHQMRLDLVIFVRGDPWDTLADAVDRAAHAALMADQPLRQLVLDIRRTGDEPESEQADKTAGTLTVSYLITYLTKAADITAQPT